MSDGKFQCSECGACCRSISEVLPDWDRGGGVCVHLNEDNRCSIYELRPLVCRVDEVRPPSVDVAAWHAMNYDACDQLHLKVYGTERKVS